MGCDIHLYREKHVDGKWVAADEWVGDEVPWEKRFTDRNYNLFAMLAGVRVREEPPYKFEPRGLPVNVCERISQALRAWDMDAHSTSYLYLFELEEVAAFYAKQKHAVSGMKDRGELRELHASIALGSPDWSLLYPYCQGTNDPKQEKFCVEVPADFLTGDALRQIIASLKELDGDNQRIVFWFDN